MMYAFSFSMRSLMSSDKCFPHLDPIRSRDRLSFSKSILRRFIRECVDRDAAVASPWTVKHAIATRYGVDTVMPAAIRQSVAELKKGESDKRRKAWEDKEGPPTKKQKKLAAAEEEKGEDRTPARVWLV